MHQAVLQFWFHDITPAQWWKVDPAFDRQIADRFGRYPHRNQILGRNSTAEELAFLATPGSSF